MRAFLLAAIATAALAACPSLPSLRSPFVAANFSNVAASGLLYENRYIDLAQIGARCQTINNTIAAGGGMGETFMTYYGDLPFPLPMQYHPTADRAVFGRSIALFPELQFPSVIVDVDVGKAGQYEAITEYLCWEVPVLGFDYVEVRISTRSPNPPSAYLDELEARARALGVQWSGSLLDVNFTSCPSPAEYEPAEPAVDVSLSPYAQAVSRLVVVNEVQAMQSVADVDSSNSSDVVMPGIRPGLPQLAFVFIQGAGVAPSAYIPFFQELQQTVKDFDVIIGAPDAPLDHTPDPVTIGSDVERVVAAMQADAGLNLSNAPVVFGAHSLGGTMVQLWLSNATITGYTPAAQVLFGAYLLRYIRNGNDTEPAFRYPTATIVGELDGLCRVSRVAESYWHQQTRTQGHVNRQAEFPVLVVPGMNHGQLATFAGPVPPTIATYDLTPEVSQAEALAAAAQYTSYYLSTVVGKSKPALSLLQKVQAASGEFFSPLVSGLVFEAYYYLLPPCYDNPPSPACQYGCPLAPFAQKLVTNAAGSNATGTYAYYIDVTDAMHPVDDIFPIHLPNITNQCDAPTAACVLNGSTVTQNSYDLLTDFDVALFPTTAHETRIKMTSRQNGLVHAGLLPNQTNFNLTDPPTVCAAVNEAVLSWALATAAPGTVKRFEAKGLPLRFGLDAEAWMGPQFTYGSLQFELVNASSSDTGTPFVWVNSTTLSTPLDYILPLTAGFHYCLLLSPARALEWIYVDSLRPFLWT